MCGKTGNELCGGGVAARIEAQQYAKDMKKLKQLVTEMFPDGKQPKVLGPGGFYDKQWFNDFLLATGPGVLDGVTHHTYNLGPGMYIFHLVLHLTCQWFSEI